MCAFREKSTTLARQQLMLHVEKSNVVKQVDKIASSAIAIRYTGTQTATIDVAAGPIDLSY